jgi:glucose/arabinose dehydrogenase
MARLTLVLVAALGGALVLGACGDNHANHATPKDATGDDGPPPPCRPVRGSKISLRPIGQVSGFAVLATAPPDDPRRLFVVERESRVRVFVDEVLQAEPFLDLTGIVYTEGTVERGLLGLAFHPQYATNGQFFVFYTTPTDGVVARCSVSPTNPNRALDSCVEVIKILHDRAGNHNGGMIEFGSDGLLYIGTGDGGGAGDPNHRPQDPNDLLGKILRIDVDHKDPGLEYGIPPTNPYAAGGGRGEVFIRGLRNPWRWSFDRATGDLWIGDVGQARFEEMTVLRPAQQNGANLGWSMYEGTGCCATQADLCLEGVNNGGPPPLPCDPTGMTFPQDARDRQSPRGTNWNSIIGGQVYRGTCYPDLVGYHFYSDIESTILAKARLRADDTLEITDLPGIIGKGTSSLHADSRGELYVTNISGIVYHLEASP